MTYPKQDSSPDVESDSNISYRSSEENSGDSDVIEDVGDNFDETYYEDKHKEKERSLEETNYEVNLKDMTTEEDYFQASLPRSFPDDEYDSDISYCYSEEVFGDSDIGNLRDFDDEEKDHLLDIYGDFPEGLEIFRSVKLSLSKQDWKRCWPKEGETEESAWVHVYGFYNEETCCGGYGVVVRNMSAKPIAASVNFSLEGVNYLYQVLKGLDAGLELASKHGCSSPRVVCNSKVVVHLLSAIGLGICHNLGCRSSKVNNVCQSCTIKMVPYMTEWYFKQVEPLLETLQGKLPFLDFTSLPRKWNKAAYSLAKQAKRTLLIYGWEFNNYKADVKPENFSDELLDILWSDAYDSVFYNLEARAMILDGAVPRLP